MRLPLFPLRSQLRSPLRRSPRSPLRSPQRSLQHSQLRNPQRSRLLHQPQRRRQLRGGLRIQRLWTLLQTPGPTQPPAGRSIFPTPIQICLI